MVKTAPTETTKLTISLPWSLVRYLDEQAAARKTSRGRVIVEILEQAKAREVELLAVEGYQFYAGEAQAFAESSLRATSEALEHAG